MLRIETAEVFQPLLTPAPYRGAWGGRGSGASAVVEHCLLHSGAKVVSVREEFRRDSCSVSESGYRGQDPGVWSRPSVPRPSTIGSRRLAEA